MEIATVITSFREAYSLFDKFIYTYPSLLLLEKDDDTAYFENIMDKRDRIYYHYKLINPEKEFSYNYTGSEVEQIKNVCGDNQLFMFDLSYRSETLLVEILKAFKIYLQANNAELIPGILINHPFAGTKKLEKNY